MWRVSSVLELSGLSTPMKAYAEETRVRGTAVHAAAERLAEGYALEPSPYADYTDGVVAFFHKFQPTVVATERRIVNRLKRLTGQLDLAALVEIHRRLHPFIIDMKTGSKACWHGIQTAGYKDLAVDDDALWALFGEPFASWTLTERDAGLRRAIVYLPGNGKFQFAEQQDPGDHWRFSSALALLQWRHDNGLLSYVDAEQPNDERGEPVQVMPGGGEPI